MKVPVLMLAAGRSASDCCSIDLDRRLAAAATAAGRQFQPIVYPDADLDFAYGGEHYNPKDDSDALQRTAEMLKVYLHK